YIIIVNAYITSLLYRSHAYVDGPSQLILTGGSMATVYVVLAHLAKSTTIQEHNEGESCVPTGQILVTQLSLSSLGIATILMVFMGGTGSGLLVTFTLGVAQAVQWSSFYCLTTSGFAMASATSQLAAFAVGVPYLQQGPFGADTSSFIIVASLVMYFLTLPRMNSMPLWSRIILMIVPLLPRSMTVAIPQTWARKSHPIELLHLEGRRQYNNMVSRQSKTVEEAITEYHRRYFRAPPTGFDSWAQLALDNDMLLIDEFDGMTKAFEPYQQVDPTVLAKILERVLDMDLDDLVIVKIENSKITSNSDKFWNYHGEYLHDWLAKPLYKELLPNLTIILNTFDEPKVVIDSKYAQPTLDQASNIQFTNFGKTHPWSRMTLNCPGASPVSEVAEHIAVEFVADLTQTQDICQHREYEKLHGFFNTPGNLNLVDLPVPLFSQARPSTFHDLMYPSPYYEAHRDDYNEEKGFPWDQKRTSLYWRGSTTGGYNTIENWQEMHRQRLVLSTIPQNGPYNVTLLERKTSRSSWNPYRTISTPKLQGLFETSVSEVVQCDEEACDELKAALPPEGSQPDSASYHHKYVLDMDGNGFSGRYYRILRSRSAVIKQTLLKEWHDDWLVPWYHFIPLSMQGSEVWEMMRFFSTDEGDEIGAAIAESSSRWTETNLR
ncbi:hypothetical protein D6D25_07831, partial [Aureobasidium pullulans]